MRGFVNVCKDNFFLKSYERTIGFLEKVIKIFGKLQLSKEKLLENYSFFLPVAPKLKFLLKKAYIFNKIIYYKKTQYF
jgi:hypothetical protein